MKLLAFVVCLSVACGASAREKEIAATYTVAVGVAAELPKVEQDHELAIVAKVKAGNGSAGDATAEVAAYRVKVDRVEKTVDLVFRAVATAAVVNTSPSLASLEAAALQLASEYAAIKAEVQ